MDIRRIKYSGAARRILAAMVSLCIYFGAVPQVKAADSEPENPLHLEKSAVLEDDGTYTITMEAYATGTQIITESKTGIPLDIVLVLDQSGSMAIDGYQAPLKNAVTEFVESISAHAKETNVNHRIAMVGFAGAWTDPPSTDVKCSVSANSATDKWLNTGLFVNGYLKNYSTEDLMGGTYVPITTDQINTNNNYYIYRSGKWYKTAYTNNKFYYFENSTLLGTFTPVNDEANESDYYSRYVVYDLRYSTDAEYSQLTAQDYKNALVSVNDASGNITASITTAISNLASTSATRTSFGMLMANRVFENNPLGENKEDRKRIIVVFTDGEPGQNGFAYTEADAALAQGYISKNTHGADVYAIGLYDSPSMYVNLFMQALSSDYSNMDSMADIEVGEDDIVSTTGSVYSPSNYVASNFSSYVGDAPASTIFVKPNLYGVVSISGGTYIVPLGVYYTESTWYGRTYSFAYKYNDVWSPYSGTPYELTRQPANDQYYMTTGDASELQNIFQTIEQTITSTQTSVTLTGDAVLRDLMAEGFILTDNTAVTATTVHGSLQIDGTIAWDTGKTLSPAPTVKTVDKENGIVEVTGFDYQSNYISQGHDGYKLIVTITGVEATDAAIQNQLVPTNLNTSGIYPDSESTTPAGLFPVPTVLLTSKFYVLDYARPADLPAAEWQQSRILHLDPSGMHRFTVPSLLRDMPYGLAQVNAEDRATLTYTPQTMRWDSYDNLYIFGKDAQNTDTNIWSKISVLPANNVYYEDDFVATDASDGTQQDTPDARIVYTNHTQPDGMSDEDWAALQGSWPTAGAPGENKEDPNGAVHGWISDLADDTGHTNGVAHLVASITGQGSANLPTASFTFTGTGVDIYSYTDSTTGTILVSVKDTAAGGKTWYYVVDNLSASGSYYQVPTVTFSGAYSTYDVKITVTTGGSKEGRFTYYLDGVRVYKPLGDQTDDTIEGAYGDEIKAIFTEIRDTLSSGTVFIDEDAEGNAICTNYDTYGDYAKYAPEHEVYLAKGESISLRVSSSADCHYYLGMKALSGSPVTAEYSYSNGEKMSKVISHTADLYYEIMPINGIITVSNNTDCDCAEETCRCILSITKLRQTGAETSQIMTLSEDDAIVSYRLFRSLSPIPEETEPPTEPEETTPPTEPEETTPPTEPEVITPPTEPEVTTPPTEPEVTTPPTDPEETTPPTEPEETTPPTEPDETTPPTEPEETTPPTEPEETTPPTEPEETTPPTEPEETTPPTEPEGPQIEITNPDQAPETPVTQELLWRLIKLMMMLLRDWFIQ